VNEEYGKIYKKLYNLDTYGLRYFNVFGKRQDPNGAYAAVIPKFIKQLLNDEAPTIHGDGKQSRDFTYIENVIEANLKACKATSEVAGDVFNIAYGGQEYLIDIYTNLCEVLNKNIEPVFGSERPGDIKHSNANILKAKYLLKYNPEFSYKSGILLAINWYKENLLDD
jgi:UDP-N-acetylglucosamine/UDP-N-acetylgalactosamine 4-epimerase